MNMCLSEVRDRRDKSNECTTTCTRKHS